ncbi:hypothetical protein NEUTE1DRAFT_114693 [Neurospora tetrasperma FGSC 2508]|uniref:Uncharacterized protein n=1 Tax=Neurospora tetrasperma (strain FGSC 2508 / ATCC MYA-4615 / P0657) TaxID=510951 RepID=F8N4Z3_NEUT8|nr:uncharacterized protein NEUTE1DRAFT_114693 [Neurospora tetrasperma FGSC 2508]EGO52777.1 hypothetical protein NEUTE1DRAFT_114693 [Neurospora tetrasperma FGSC 2508]
MFFGKPHPALPNGYLNTTAISIRAQIGSPGDVKEHRTSRREQIPGNEKRGLFWYEGTRIVTVKGIYLFMSGTAWLHKRYRSTYRLATEAQLLLPDKEGRGIALPINDQTKRQSSTMSSEESHEFSDKPRGNNCETYGDLLNVITDGSFHLSFLLCVHPLIFD